MFQIVPKLPGAEVLRIANYRRYQTGRLLFIFGLQMQSVIMSFYVYSITHDALSLGLIGLAEAIPFISVALVSGNVADLYNRKKIILYATCGYLLCALAMTVIVFSKESLHGHTAVQLIYVVVFLTGIARGFLSPAQAAMLSQIVPKELFGQSATWNSMVWNVATVGGPAVGGLLYAWLGERMAMEIVVVFCAIGISRFFMIHHVHETPVIGNESTFERLKAGFVFVKKTEVLLAAITLDMLAVLFGGAVALLPVFASEILHVGPQGLGFLRAAPSIGAVVCSIWVAYFPIQKSAGKIFIANVFLFGCSMIAFALSKNYWLSLSLLILSGAFDNVSVIVRSIIYQTFTPNEMRGRVSAINFIFIGSSNEIGSFESGFAARLFGTVPSVIAGGMVTLLVSSSTAVLAKKLWKLDFQ